MKHFGSAEWVDFVNGVAEPTHETAMRKHLEEGCQACATQVELLQRVRLVAAREKDYQPPEHAVHIAKAAFSASGWARRATGAKGAIELLFDSFRQPLLAGVRSAGSTPRRMLYAADPLKIDLQLEAQAEGQTVIVTGQLLDLRQPGAVVRDTKVTLSNSQGHRVEATTNEFGEFREEIEDKGDLQLTLPGASGEPLVISLPDVRGRSRNEGN